jgi:hypothetical protein
LGYQVLVEESKESQLELVAVMSQMLRQELV